jgi:PTS system nitrogen regulatory IIA component
MIEVQLMLAEVARLFGVNEHTVTGWVNDDNLPCEVVEDHYRFNRAELLEWATFQKLTVSPTVFQKVNGNRVCEQTLVCALERGAIVYGVAAADKNAAIEAVVDGLPLPCGCDRELMLQLFHAREALGSTALGEGIAIPHPRRPIVLNVPRPLVRLVFLATPVDFQASDGKPVDTLFAIVAPTVHEHLQLLARIASVLKDAHVRQALRSRAPEDELLAAICRVEQGLCEKPGGSV